jgi:hypothetical protein
MNTWRRALVVALVHLAIVGSLAAKFSYDRATRPRVWVKTMGYDPDLPIRGRYLAMQVKVATDVGAKPQGDPNKYHWYQPVPVRLEARGTELWAVNDARGSEMLTYRDVHDSAPVPVLSEPVLFFLSESAANPMPASRNNGTELWVEVTVPKKGPPRPIRLGLKKDGVLTPLALD